MVKNEESNEIVETLYRRFLRAVSDHNMLKDVKSVLVGFSGGADSTALLDMLMRYGKENGLAVYALHVNHMIRGEEADRDMNFCKDFCAKRGIKLFCVKEDIPKLSKETGMGLEEAARKVRYTAFDRVAKENHIEKIATAHNSSDNLETVIFNLARGSGISGLCGIPPVRDEIIRPLIYCSKADILSYCTAKQLLFVTDGTNSDIEYTRNYIRHVIVPELKKLNFSVEDTVSRNCVMLRYDKEKLDRDAEELFSTLALDSKGAFSVSGGDSIRKFLCGCDNASLSRILKRMAEENGCLLSAVQLSDIMGAIRSEACHVRVSLTGGADLEIDRDIVRFVKSRAKQEAADFCIELKEGTTYLPDGSAIYLNSNGDTEETLKDIKRLKNIYKLSIHTIINSDKIEGRIFARSRKEGDSYRFGCMTRNVRKLIQSTKISISERPFVPLICDKGGICFLPGFPVRDGIAPDDTINKTCITYFKGERNDCEKS